MRCVPRGITADDVPVLSFSVTEALVAEDTARMAGHYAARNYFQTVNSPENRDFVKKFQERFGSRAVLDSPTEASYVNMRMWIDAAREAGSGSLSSVQRTILRESLPAPEGIVSLIPSRTMRGKWRASAGRARMGSSISSGNRGGRWSLCHFLPTGRGKSGICC